jgi:hypothetical protein
MSASIRSGTRAPDGVSMTVLRMASRSARCSSLVLEHLRDLRARVRCLHDLGELAGAEAVARDRGTVEGQGQLGDVDLLLDGQVHDAGDAFHHRLDLLGGGAESGQVVAEDLDGDAGPGARQHVVDSVGDGAAQRRDDTRHRCELLA